MLGHADDRSRLGARGIVPEFGEVSVCSVRPSGIRLGLKVLEEPLDRIRCDIGKARYERRRQKA